MEDLKNADGDFESSAFEALERDFQEILQELVGDRSLEHFRQEYEKLHRALKKSHESEKGLIKKCRELNTEIVQNAVKVQTALKLSQEDQATITALKKEIERAWKMVETSHEKEQRAKETIQNLKSEISKLGRLVEQGAGLSINQENMVNQLVQEKNDLIKHRDMLQGQVGQLSATNSDLNARVNKLEFDRAAGGSVLSGLKEQLDQLMEEGERQQKRKEKLDMDLKDLRNALEAKQNEIALKKEESQKNAEAIAKLEGEYKTERHIIDGLTQTYNSLEDTKDSLKKANAEEVLVVKKLCEDRADLKTQLKGKEEEVTLLRKQKDRLSKQFEQLKKKKSQGDAETAKLLASTQALKTDITALVKECDGMKRQAELEGKQIVDLTHERDILNKSVVKADERSKTQVELVRRHEAQANTLAKDLRRWKSELKLMDARTDELARQREKYENELNMAKAQYHATDVKLKKRDETTAQLKKSIADVKAKLSQQKNLYEAVRTDKNLYHKNLADSQEEIAEMRKKFKSMYLHIEHLKEEIKEKNKALITEHFEHEFIIKEMEKTNENLSNYNKRQKRLEKQVVELQQQEIKKLEATIQEAEVEKQNQRKEFEAVTSERNILSTQLIRRNDELELLYEKIKIQESTLKKGEIQYKARLEEIKTEKEGIAALKLDLFKAKRQADNIDDHKKEVYHLQRDLLQERTKVKALSEELENPMNVHRWRKLEGSDPAMYELIQKVRTLQKRLIQKTEEVVAKDHEIGEKERLHKELKGILEKQPGPEVMEQLELYQENLASKSKQMKAMQSELKTYQAQVGDYKDEIDRLTRELQEVKKKYFDQKRREQVQQEAQRGDTKVIHPRPVATVRFTGGGFNLAH
mmetsp:Transcript_87719/g.246441  ORF Transcript_87719/g.246441 Transcript_87719/m.246441 type:complete len:868 (-) Transcript_87719:149-2752(-)|eukprot:CAMPEP_0117501116 /NCGR_PEP_ID=MMETSP0784-20121206/23129_1 /TAXON_ID=39447 /ORGANISM="" /LENGTH=867 /DNA_ID=CAMNT_0005296353 /DNA_START=1 /DNA_END=2604 /DNA_ORIENTATION=-